MIARTKNVHDGALPAGTGIQALNLLRLAQLGAEPAVEARADAVIQAQAALVNRHPRLFSHLLMAIDFAHAPHQIVISGERGREDTSALLRSVRASFLPQRVVVLADAHTSPEQLPITRDRGPSGAAKAYVCRNQTCAAPISDPDQLARVLRTAVTRD